MRLTYLRHAVGLDDPRAPRRLLSSEEKGPLERQEAA